MKIYEFDEEKFLTKSKITKKFLKAYKKTSQINCEN